MSSESRLSSWASSWPMVMTTSSKVTFSSCSPSAAFVAGSLYAGALAADGAQPDLGTVVHEGVVQADKGTINQRAVLSHRADTVAALHEDRLHFILKPQV